MNYKYIYSPLILLAVICTKSFSWTPTPDALAISPSIKIYNFSWSPIALKALDTNLAKIYYVGETTKTTDVKNQKLSNPITINKKEVIIPFSFYERGMIPYTPEDPRIKNPSLDATFKTGWKDTEVTHKNTTTMLDKSGHWIFSDEGVFFTGDAMPFFYK